METEGLHRHWLALLQPHPAALERGEPVFQKIVRQYSARRRHYHNLAHLQELFRQLDTFRAQLRDPQLVAAAIFFHDIVYRPTRRDNEARSAEIAATDLAALGFPTAEIDLVHRFILATQRHEIPAGENHPDLPWLLDFDLAILGAPAVTYAEYARQIRREYRIYPDLMYRPGRRQALSHFLERPRIFHTPVFWERYEQSARENLAREIAALS